MKRNYQNLRSLVVAGSLLLSGCTAGLVEETVPEEARPVELSFVPPRLGVAVETRAETPEATSLPEDSTVRIVAYRLGAIGATTQAANFATDKPFAQATYRVTKTGGLTPCQVDASGRLTSGEGAEPLSVRSGMYDFYAVSPARPLTDGGSGGTSAWQICDLPHKEDVMTSFARNCQITQTAPSVTLATFKRQCAQVVFTVASSSKNIVPLDTLRGVSLVLTGLSKSGANLSAGVGTTIVPTGGEQTAAGTVCFDSTEFVPVVGEAAEKQGLNKTIGVVLPKDGAPFYVSVTVQRDTSVVTLSAPVGKQRAILFEAGKRYVFTLEVENYLSRLYLNVVPWVSVSFTDNAVGGADPSVPTDPVITPGTPLGFVVAEWKNIDWEGTVGAGEKNNQIQ